MNHNYKDISTLITAFGRQSQRTDRGITFINSSTEEQFISYAELYQQSIYTLGKLQEQGLSAGNQVILQIEDNKTFLHTFWACILGGIIPAPLSTGNQDHHMQKLIEVFDTLENPRLICEQVQIQRLEKYAKKSDQSDKFKDIEEHVIDCETILDQALAGIIQEASPSDIAYIQFSSGSTGAPKGVILTHENLVYNTSDIATRSQIDDSDRMLSWMPLTHDMGLICFHLTGVLTGVQQYIMHTALFIRRPILWIEKTHEYGATLLYSPNFGYSYFLSAFHSFRPEVNWDLSNVKLIYNGAEPISKQLCQQFLDEMTIYGLPSHCMFPGYGLAEASVAVCLPTVGDVLKDYTLDRNSLKVGQQISLLETGDDRGVSFIEVGHAIDHCTVRIVDEEDQPLESAHVGHIQIKGNNVTAGYFNRPDATVELFSADGWLKTGDLGFLIEGRLVVTGRAKNIIIVNGQNFYPQDIERTAECIEGIDLGKIVACGIIDKDTSKEELFLFVLFKGKDEKFLNLASELRLLVLDKFGLNVSNIIPVKKIPKTTSGKIQHFKLASEYLRGDFDEKLKSLRVLQQNQASVSTTLQIENEILRLAKEIFNDTQLDTNTNFFDLGITSLKATQLASRINDLLGCSINSQLILETPSVAEINQNLNHSQKGTGVLPTAIKTQENYEISATQKRFWVLDQSVENATALNISLAFELNGTVDELLLEEAAQMVYEKHEGLRSTFKLVDQEPRQQIHDPAELPLSFTFLDITQTENPSTRSKELMDQETQKRFDLERDSLLQLKLIQKSEQNYVLLCSMHHIISDGWSVLLFLDELATNYRLLLNKEKLTTSRLPLQQKDHTVHEQKNYDSEKYLADKKYWLNQFRGELPQFSLSLAAQKSTSNQDGAVAHFEISAPTTSKLYAISKEAQTTLFTTVMAAVNLLLYKYTGKSDAIIGTDIAGRDQSYLENIIGCFIKTFAIRSKFDDESSFSDLMGLVKERLKEAFNHQSYSFEQLNNDLAINQQQSNHMLFDVLVVFQNFNQEHGLEALPKEIEVDPIPLDSSSSLVDLHFEFIERGNSLTYSVRYNARRYAPEQIERLGTHFNFILEQIVKNTSLELTQYQLITEDEKQLLASFQGKVIEYPEYTSLIDLFENNIEQYLDHVALIYDGRTYTYQDIRDGSNQLAAYLNYEHGIKAGDRIGLLMTSSEQSIITLLAILKLGATLVPLSTSFPVSRIEYIAKDSHMELLIADDDTFGQSFDLTVLEADTLIDKSKGFLSHTISTSGTSHDLAYILYTSGTTGKPKGVLVPHRAALDYVQTFSEYFNISEDDIVIHQSELSFDTSIEEIFPTLCQGGTLNVMPEGGKDVNAIWSEIEAGRATVLSSTPLVIEELNRLGGALNSLRILISGGDQLKPAHIDQLINKTKIYNTYGPTEATVCTTFKRIEGLEDCISIGKPIANHNVYLLSDQMEEVPVGVEGEICIAGAGVALGYSNNKKETDLKFVSSPFGVGETIYKTGDLGRWNNEGEIEFIGRKDHQVKINGYRIEIEEIEHALFSMDGVGDVVIQPFTNQESKQLLAAYYTGKQISASLFRTHLLKELPYYMVPSYFIRLDYLPANAHGKIDRQALPTPKEAPKATKKSPSVTNPAEEKMTEIWRKVLGQESLGVEDNFFELGGNSILGTKIVARVQEQFKVRCALRDVFTYPTILQLTDFIQQSDEAELQMIAPVAPAPSYPLSNAQKRMWILDQFKGAKAAYHLSWVYTIEGDLDSNHLQSSIRKIIERHESLRTNFILEEGEPRQIVKKPDEVNFDLKLKNIAGSNENHQADELIDQEINAPFDLSKDLLIRGALVQAEKSNCIFVLCIHHIVSDGLSMQIFVDELTEYYNDLCKGVQTSFSPLKFHYKDYVAWQEKQLRSKHAEVHKAYWLEEFNQSQIPVLELPTQFPRPLVQSYQGDTTAFLIEEDLKDRLTTLGAQNNTSLFVVLLSAVYTLLYKYTDQKDIVVGTPVAGRQVQELENQMGLFINTLALRTQFDPERGFADLLAIVNQKLLSAFEHQIFPFDELVDLLEVSQDTSRSPLFDVMVGYQNKQLASNRLSHLHGLAVKEYPIKNTSSQFDLSIDFFDEESEVRVSIEYNTDLFSKSYFQRFIGQFKQLLDNITRHGTKSLSTLSILPVDQKEQLLKFNRSTSLSNMTTNVQQQFEAQVKKTPKETAVSFGTEHLTYDELNQQANQVAHYLREEIGVIQNDRVGLLLDRNEQIVVYVLGVLKSGATYVPIDPDYPEERINLLIEDSNMKVLLTNIEGYEFKYRSRVEKISLSVLDLSKYPTTNTALINDPEDAAYMIYTSGSTGRPKGVRVAHRNLANVVESWKYHYRLEQMEVCTLQMASMSFDVFMGDLCRTLLFGGRLIICPTDDRLDPTKLASLIMDNKVTVMESTPALILPLMQYFREKGIKELPLELLILGSDTCLASDYQQLIEAFGQQMRIINSYGTTETTIDSSFYEGTVTDSPVYGVTPIGKPMQHNDFYIVGINGELQPIGVPGELCIGGAAVSLGYHNQAELNQTKFIKNPYTDEGSIYKTGDLAKWSADGNVEYIGREDYQVKIRGYRIELGEIEDTLTKFEGIQEAVVLPWEEDGVYALTAYYRCTKQFEIATLQAWVRDQLPSYMVPAYFMSVQEFGLTPNGKIDRKALTRPDLDQWAQKQDFVAPTTSVEKAMVSIWESVLNRADIGIKNNFFDLGGHSLKAAKVIAAIHQTFSVNLGLRTLFTHPTIEDLSKLVQSAGKEEYLTIEKVAVQEDYPVSHAQKRLWLMDQMEEDSRAYNMPVAFEISGALDISSLRDALNALYQRHEILRTVFVDSGSEPRQKVLDGTNFELCYDDLRTANLEEKDLEEKLSIEAHHVFDLHTGPLFIGKIFHVTEDQYWLFFNMHHIISDGWSTELLIKELTTLYNHFHAGKSLELNELSIQYKDYAAWQREVINSGLLESQATYWLDQFSHSIPVLELPTDRLRPSTKTYRGAAIHHKCSVDRTASLSELASKQGATLFMTLMATVKALFYRYSHQEDMVIGFPVAGRNQSELEDQIGFYVNTLALRTQFSGNEGFETLLRAVKKGMIGAYDNQDYPFDLLLEQLDLVRDMSRSPLFDVMVVFQNTEVQGKGMQQMADLNVSACEWDVSTSKFDMIINFIEDGDQLEILIEYNTDLFDEPSMTRLIQHYESLLDSILEDINLPLIDLEYLSAEEQQELLPSESQQKIAYPKGATIQTLFEEQVRLRPNAVAIACEGRELSYDKLNERANQLAHQLISDHNTNPGDLIGIMMGRSEQMIVGILGILKSGAAYVPIDPEYPEERRNYTLQDSGVKTLIHDGAADISSLQIEKSNCINIDKLKKSRQKWQKENPKVDSTSHDAAYVIYTSGSSGLPKGVLIEHDNVVRLLKNEAFQFDFSENDVWTLFHSICFDFSVWEMFGALLYGGKLVIVAKETAQDAASFATLLVDHKVTVLNQIPGVFNHLTNEILSQRSRYDVALRYVIFGGEALNPATLTEWYKQYPSVSLVNMYGITETTVHTTFKKIEEEEIRDGNSNIGQAIPTVDIYLLDENLGLVPRGVVGEICVGGKGVARGYLNRPELTHERFIANPYRSGQKLYLSGDLGLMTMTGDIEYIGRKDFQVKIRGYRIELGEIEDALVRFDPVSDATVLAIEDDGEYALVAYFTSVDEVDISMLRTWIQNQLPAYMVPSFFMAMDRFPLTANGKVDRKALPIPDKRMHALEYVEPKTAIEVKMEEIWSSVLNLEKVSIRANFFDLGGHSLKASKVISRIYQEFSVQLGLRALFTLPTIEGLSELVEVAKKTKYHSIAKITPQADYALSHAQRRLWILDQIEEDRLAYNMPVVYQLNGTLDLEALKASFQSLINRHDILRTSFGTKDGEPRQKVHEKVPFEWTYTDLSHQALSEHELSEIMQPEVDRTFDLTKAPLLRVTLYRVSPSQHLLLFCTHHIVSDGWSSEILFNELTQWYNYHSVSESLTLADLPIQYADYSAWQMQMLEGDQMHAHRNYWNKQFQGVIPVLNLPTDRTRPAIKTFRGATVSKRLSTGQTEELRELSKVKGVSMFMLLMTLVKALVYRYSRQEDIIVGFPVAGRDHKELENQVGFYVNTLALRTQLSGRSDFNELLQNVKEGILKAYQHQQYPFDLLLEELDLKRDISRSPLFDVMVVYQNAAHTEATQVHMKGLVVEEKELESTVSKFDLILNFKESKNHVDLLIEYNTDLFDQARMNRMLDHYDQLISSVLIDSSLPLNRLPYLTPTEETRFLSSAEDRRLDLASEATIVSLFEAQVAEHPDHVALVFEESSMTYFELNEKANQLAHYLRNNFAVSPNELIGLLVDRSEQMIVGILGILKSGAAYVPIDPEYPEDRRHYIISNARINRLVCSQTDPSLDKNITQIILQDKKIGQEKKSNPITVNTQEDLIYVIHTSGTTGRPKGAQIMHQSIVNLAFWLGDLIYNKSDQPLKVALTASISFDSSVKQIFPALLHGATLNIISDDCKKDIFSYIKTLAKNEISVMDITPSFLAVLLDTLQNSNTELGALKYTLVGGEVLKTTIAEHYYHVMAEDSQLINVYGVTEAAVDSTFEWVSKKGRKSAKLIGKLLPNTEAYVLDEHQELLPIGVMGELYIGGVGVAKGYINQPDLTAERFVDHPFKEGEKLYKTGDLARWYDYENLEFFGRNDRQVNLKGYRIELEEVENQILALAEIKECAVILVTDKSESSYLQAFYSSESPLDDRAIRKQLTERLPSYMIPFGFLYLKELPKTNHGKLDHHVLQALAVNDTKTALPVAPSNKIETELIKIWQLALGRNGFGTQDNFFDLGGDSLKAMKVFSEIYKQFNTQLSIKSLFTAPTIQDLAKSIISSDTKEFKPIPILEKVEKYGLSNAQKRLWVLDQFAGNQAAYNIPIAYRFSGTFDKHAFRKTIDSLVERHEILRTNFLKDQGQPWQVVHPMGQYNLDYVHLDFSQEKAKDQKVERLAQEEVNTGFDLGEDRLIRVKIVTLSDQEHICLLTLHHIVSDALSNVILKKDISELYQYHKNGGAWPLKPLGIHYKDFAAWQQEFLSGKQLDHLEKYWKTQFSGQLHTIEIPTGKQRPKIRTSEGKTVNFRLDAGQRKKLTQIGADQNATLFMVLTALVKSLLYRYTSQNDIVITSPIAGREHPDLSDQVGFYANTLALRTEVVGADTFNELLVKVKRVIVEAYEHQAYPFDLLTEVLNIPYDPGYSPLSEVMIVVQEAGQDQLQLDDLKVTLIDVENSTVRFDLLFVFNLIEDELEVELVYNSSIFDKSLVSKMQDHFKNIVAAVITNSQQKIFEIPMLGRSEQSTLFQTAYNQRVDLHSDLLTEFKKYKHANQLALQTRNGTLTYRELDLLTDQIAASLMSQYKLTSGDHVIIDCQDTTGSVVAFLTLLKTGLVGITPTDEELVAGTGRFEAKLRFTDYEYEELTESCPSFRLDEFKAKETSVEFEYFIRNQDSPIVFATERDATGTKWGRYLSDEDLLNLMNHELLFKDTDQWLMAIRGSLTNHLWEICNALLSGAQILTITSSEENEKVIKPTVLSLTSHELNQWIEDPSTSIQWDAVRMILLDAEEYSSTTSSNATYYLKDTDVNFVLTLRSAMMGGPVAYEEIKATTTSLGFDKSIGNTQMMVMDADGQPLPAGVIGTVYLSNGEIDLELIADCDQNQSMYFRHESNDPFILKTTKLGMLTVDKKLRYVGKAGNELIIKGKAVTEQTIKQVIEQHQAVADLTIYPQEGQEVGYEVAIVPKLSEAFTIRQLLAFKQLDRSLFEDLYYLPNGAAMFQINNSETDFTYDEIFTQHGYLKHGINIAEGDVIFDVGANIGMFSMYASLNFPGTEIYSFEPLYPIYKVLSANAGLYPDTNITTFNIGLSSKEEEATFSYYKQNTIISGRFGSEEDDKSTVRRYLINQFKEDGISLSEKRLEELVEESTTTEDYNCKLRRLSDVIKEQNIEKIDLLKIDVEKSELEILGGIEDHDWKKIIQIIIEVHDIAGRLEFVTDLLKKKGFHITIEQDEILKDTNLYNIYGVMKKSSVAQPYPAELSFNHDGAWTNIEKLTNELERTCSDQLPMTTVDAVKLSLVSQLPLDAKGAVDLINLKAEIAKERAGLNKSEIESNHTILVSATFTSEPFEQYAQWWSEKFDLNLAFEFSSYNQVLQDLLQADQKPGHVAHLILLRFEDLIRELDKHATDKEMIALLDETVQQLKSLVISASEYQTLMVGVFPAPPKGNFSKKVYRHLLQLNRHWGQFLNQLSTVYVVDFIKAEENYNLQKIFDEKSDKIGHIPFTDTFYASMASTIVRTARVLFQPSSKVIALDCDNTLWRGVCGEEGALGVKIEDGHRQLQEFCLRKYEEGFLLVISSKNNEEDVWSVFDENPGMLLERKHFVSWRINWDRKSLNLHAMAEELNVGIDSFCFLDDSLVECHEVMTNCPEALTIQVPEGADDLEHLLHHLWSLDKLDVTNEDKKRSEMYLAEKNRLEAKSKKANLDQFLSDLNIEVSMSSVDEDSITRLSQLTDRTNQFNCNKNVYSEIALKNYLKETQRYGWGVEVRDKYGSYGITGLVMAQVEGQFLVIDTFLLSCRVLGRNVEFALIARLLQRCQQLGLEGLLIQYKASQRNAPALQFIEELGGEMTEESQNVCSYFLATKTQLNKSESVTLYYDEKWPGHLDETIETKVSNTDEAFTFDHIGVAVRDIEKAAREYAKLGYQCFNKIYDPIQNVFLMICEKNEMDRIELVAPFDKNSPVNHILEVNGDLPYHTCYKVANIERALEFLKRASEFEIIGKPEKAILFDNKLVQFIQVKEVGLIELLQDPDGVGVDSTDFRQAAVTLKVAAFDIEKAAEFYQRLGYEKGNVICDDEHQVTRLGMSHPDGAPEIEICMPEENEKLEEYKFLLKNNAHPYKIALKSENKGLSSSYLQEHVIEKTASLVRSWDWKKNLVNEEQLKHKAFYHALTYSTENMLRKMPLEELNEGVAQPQDLTAPKNTLEHDIAKIWKDLLKIDGISVTDQFIRLGGNSIKATQLLSRLEETFKVDIGLNEFFNHATIRGLAELIGSSTGIDYQPIPLVAEQPYYDVSHSQSRLWYAYQLNPEQIIYNIPALYKIEGDFNEMAFKKAIVGIFDRHESLRTIFKEVDGVPKQVIQPTPMLDEVCQIIDLQGSKQTEQSVMEIAKEMVCKPFQLETGPLMKTWLFKIAKEEYYFCQVTHHIISDGWSVGVEVNDLLHLYHSNQHESEDILPQLSVQYKDFAAWEQQQLQGNSLSEHRKYWLSQFENEISRINLPYDQPRPRMQRAVGDVMSVTIDENLTLGINQLIQAQGISTFMFMMGVFKILLYKLSGQTDLIVGIPYANRSHRDLEGQIGFYVNTLPIRTQLDPSETFVQTLLEIKHNTLMAYDHGIYPFNKLLDELHVDPDPSRSPMFDVMLQMQDENIIEVDSELQPDGLTISSIEIQKGTSKFDLLLNVVESNHTILLDIEYSTDLFHRATIQKIKTDIIKLLQEVTREPEIKLATLRKILLGEDEEKKTDHASEFITELGEDF